MFKIFRLGIIGGFVRHCCNFKADDIYYLIENSIYPTRKLSIGFCPICNKPVTELYFIKFDGAIEKYNYSGLNADRILNKYKDEILYSMKECNYLKFKSKPYGWKYGVNKSVKIAGRERLRQYACDFYGNKEIVKTI